MKKIYVLSIFAFACLAGSSVVAMQAEMTQAQRDAAATTRRLQREAQARLFTAIKKADLVGMNAAFAQGANGTDVYANFGTPIEFTLDQAITDVQGAAIIALLVLHGANRNELNKYLPGFAASGDELKVQWFIAQGARDPNGAAAGAAQTAMADAAPYATAQELSCFQRIITLLQQNQQ